MGWLLVHAQAEDEARSEALVGGHMDVMILRRGMVLRDELVVEGAAFLIQGQGFDAQHGETFLVMSRQAARLARRYVCPATMSATASDSAWATATSELFPVGLKAAPVDT